MAEGQSAPPSLPETQRRMRPVRTGAGRSAANKLLEDVRFRPSLCMPGSRITFIEYYFGIAAIPAHAFPHGELPSGSCNIQPWTGCERCNRIEARARHREVARRLDVQNVRSSGDSAETCSHHVRTASETCAFCARSWPCSG